MHNIARKLHEIRDLSRNVKAHRCKEITDRNMARAGGGDAKKNRDLARHASHYGIACHGTSK
jgi:hypothetical protein